VPSAAEIVTGASHVFQVMLSFQRKQISKRKERPRRLKTKCLDGVIS
jgi:hypothetical protein